MNLNNFFNLDEDIYFFPYDFSILELKKESTYIFMIIPKVDINEDMINSSFIKKFRLKSFDNEAYEEISTVLYNEYLRNRIIDAFYMDDYKTLVVLTYVKQSFDFYFKFYNHNLKPLSYVNDFRLYSSLFYNDEMLFKSIYLGNQYVLFAYVKDYWVIYIQFDLLKINYLSSANYFSPIRDKDLNVYNFNIDEFIYDFVKIDDKRLAFIYTSSISESLSPWGLDSQNNNKLLFIILIDMIQNLEDFTIRLYTFNLDNLVPKMKFSVNAYNGYLLFSSTVILGEGSNNNIGGSQDYFSIFMTLGYANGTDDTIDISYYLNDHYNYGENNYNF